MFNVKVLKAPTKKASGVLSAFTKAITELGQVADQHDEYAKAQLEVAANAQQEADAAAAESATARGHIEALNNALGMNKAPGL